jgi:DNA invertase Pin-like site-specific DNA recombinase
LKGSLNEYELDLLRQRSLEARRAKARRGELIVMAPVGYRKTEDRILTIGTYGDPIIAAFATLFRP